MPHANAGAGFKRRLRSGSALGILVFGLICFGAAGIPITPALAQTAAQPAATDNKGILKSEELDQLLAPIALYPDALLSEVLMASTYPLEVVEAGRWAQQNKSLKGDALKKAVDQKSWDESVKSLTAVPDVLNMMSDKLDWTQKLGDAVLAQQPDVMDAVQRLRQKAQANDKLKTTKQQKVTTTTQNNKQYVVIEPAVPDTIYVPYYDPGVVYGAWPYPAYPPYFFPAPGYIAGGLIATGIAFGAGYAIGRWASGGNYWGGGVNWGGNTINVNRPIDINNTKINNFVHNPDHRHGVRYNNDGVRQKFAKGDVGNRNQRMDFRGRDGQQVLHPDRPGSGERPNFDRPGGDKRPDGRPGGGDRAQKGTRPGSDRASKGPRREGGNRPSPRPGQHGGAFNHIDRGGLERIQANRGHASLGGRGGGMPHVGGGGGGRPHMGGGGRPGGGFHGGGRGGGGRRR